MRGQRMAAYLPGYYETSRVIRSLMQVEGTEVDKLRETLSGALDQFFARSATWSLDAWESELGLPPAPEQPVSERQDRIVSRIRGVGTATIRVVKEVAESYELGAVDIMEDTAAYTIWVRFVDTIGAPPNLEDLKDAVRAVLPAHLQVEYAFKYLLVGQLHQTMTIAEMQTRRMTDFAPFIPN
ncbi:DUF2313 domain-containing protein [Paenibacillus ginsengarvi]|uniref:DUF2313 domain-containing protein n=1 Tax=Paenibacillus ginsengarvi TaxID=400777 RepID=A0A3B0CLE6_9BACL|nr:DUF2313 domain-containing protein [Paenibacillus ginsengarvi]